MLSLDDDSCVVFRIVDCVGYAVVGVIVLLMHAVIVVGCLVRVCIVGEVVVVGNCCVGGVCNGVSGIVAVVCDRCCWYDCGIYCGVVEFGVVVIVVVVVRGDGCVYCILGRC